MATVPDDLATAAHANITSLRPASPSHPRPDLPRRLDGALRVLPLPAFVLDEAGQVVDGNRALLALLGVNRLAEVGPEWISPPVLRRMLRMVQREGQVQAFYVRLQRPSGSSRPAALTAVQVRKPDQRPQIQGVLVDLATERELRQQLLDSRRVDHLTGCRNRLFVAELAALCDPGIGNWGVVTLNVVGFRELNRTLGARAGDEILRRLAERLQRALRPGEAAVRLGGDTFALVLLEADGEIARTAAESAAAAAASMHPPVSLATAWAIRQEREPLERTLVRAEDLLAETRLLHVKP